MKNLLLSSILCFCSILAFAQSKATTHKVEKGETLYSISKKYHVTVAAIEQANKSLSGDMKIKPGQGISIPAASAKAKTDVKATTTASSAKAAPVKATDKKTTTVADKKVPVVTAKATPTASKPVVADNPSSHTVVKGESLYSLAHTYGVSVKNLREANNMSEQSAIKIGQKLNIPAKNPEAMYDTKAKVAKTEEKAPVALKPPTETTEPGREYLANDNTPPTKAEIKAEKKADRKEEKVEKKEEKLEEKKEMEAPKAVVTPVKVSEEKPSTPAVTDRPKEIIREEKATEPKEPKSAVAPSEAMKNTNVRPTEYVSVFNGYGTEGKKKVVYRGIGSFLKSENPGNQYLALYNYADMGAILKVTNLMSKQAIYVKVIGKVPASDAQNEVILKVSGEAASQLKVAEDKFLVEVTGYNE